MILSHNSIAHLLMTLAAYTVRSPVVPVSVAYSLQSLPQGRVRERVAQPRMGARRSVTASASRQIGDRDEDCAPR
jgi:hypothetical protein